MRKVLFILLTLFILYPLLPNNIRSNKINDHYKKISKSLRIYSANMFSSLSHITHVPISIVIYKDKMGGSILWPEDNRLIYIKRNNEYLNIFQIIGFSNNLNSFDGFEFLFKKQSNFKSISLDSNYGLNNYFFNELSFDFYNREVASLCLEEIKEVKTFVHVKFKSVENNTITVIESPFLFWDCTSQKLVEGNWNE